MALINYVPDDLYTSILGSSVTANLLRAIFNAPAWAQAFVKLSVTQMSQLELPADDRELVILRTAFNYSAPYIEGMHEGVAVRQGITAEQIGELRRKNYNDAVFSPKQRSLLKLVDMLCDGDRNDRRVVLSAKEHYSDRELVEIIGVNGLAYTVAKVTVVLEIEPDRLADDNLDDFIAQVATR